MKTAIKIIITAVIGLICMWICYQVFNLDQVVTTVVSILMVSAAYSVCDKLFPNKQKN